MIPYRLKKEEHKQLLGNIHEVLETHQYLLANLEATVLQGISARVGNLFITLAPRLKSIHAAYCNNHPQAVCILDRYRYLLKNIFISFIKIILFKIFHENCVTYVMYYLLL